MDVQPLKDAYWEIVADCLERFHGYSRPEARGAASALRRDLERPPTGEKLPPYGIELFYHEEPFHTACDIAGRELAPGAFDEEYAALLRERYRPAEEELIRRGVLPPAIAA